MTSREFNNGLLAVACVVLLTGCIHIATPTPYPTYTPYPAYTPQSTLAFPLAKYESEQVSMTYPVGWKIEEEQSDRVAFWGPSLCSSLHIMWDEWTVEIAPTAEDRYGANRYMAYSSIVDTLGNKPEFEILGEYRLGEARVFEYQYWNDEKDSMLNEQLVGYIDPQAHKAVIAGWQVWGDCSDADRHQWMGFRRALFDTVMQSITLR